jgi:hypothetical protein
MKAVLFFLSALIIGACTNSTIEQSKNVELINNYVSAVENMDYDAMESYLDDSYVGIGPSINDSINKVQAVESWKNNVENLYASIKYNRSRTIATVVPDGDNKGNWVSNWAELTINYKSGKGPITIFANTVYKVENGKITKSHTFYNEADALRQLGYVFLGPDEQ